MIHPKSITELDRDPVNDKDLEAELQSLHSKHSWRCFKGVRQTTSDQCRMEAGRRRPSRKTLSHKIGNALQWSDIGFAPVNPIPLHRISQTPDI